MKQRANVRLRVSLWVVITLVLVVISAGTLFAAGEQLQRGAVLSGGGTVSGGTLVLRSTAGLPVAGHDISSSSGLGLCSGFGCDFPIKDDPDEPGDKAKIFMPKLERQSP